MDFYSGNIGPTQACLTFTYSRYEMMKTLQGVQEISGSFYILMYFDFQMQEEGMLNAYTRQWIKVNNVCLVTLLTCYSLNSGQNAHFWTHKKSAKMALKYFFLRVLKLKKINFCTFLGAKI